MCPQHSELVKLVFLIKLDEILLNDVPFHQKSTSASAQSQQQQQQLGSAVIKHINGKPTLANLSDAGLGSDARTGCVLH